MFRTHLINEVIASLDSIKELLEEQEKQLDMADERIDILLEIPIESRDEQYYHIVDCLIDQYGYYLDRYKDNVKLHAELVTVLKTLTLESDLD